MKKFMRKTEGFTLVELIVVIAILGILAGVGTVGYSGYIKKANMAADEQLLATVNHAFATACIENGVDAKSYNDGSVVAKLVDGKVTEVSKHNESFVKYYVGNENSAFKVISKLVFERGMFVAMDPNGKELTAGQQVALDKFNNSNMQGKAVELAGSVDNISGLFVNWLGGTDATGSVASLAGYFSEEEFLEMKTKYGLDENSTSTQVSNATILYVASKASSMNAAEIMNTMQNAPNLDAGMEAVIQKYGPLPTAALMYGAVTGYAHSDYASSDFQNYYKNNPPKNLTEAFAIATKMTMEENYSSYSASTTDGALCDMDGYLGALQIISNYEDSFNINNAHTFNDDSAIKLMNAILGQQG